MNESGNPSTSTSALPQARAVRPHRWVPSLIWLVPLLAAAIGLSLFIKSLSERGPEITITFLKAEGLEAGKTQVKYKDVDIGQVTSVRLSDDKTRAVAVVRLDKQAASFAVQGSRFWVVRPRVGAGGVSGLGTLFSGSYLGVDAGTSEERQTEFVGLEVPPPVTADVPGKRFVLKSSNLGSVDMGSPIYYRRLQAGQVIGFQLDETGRAVDVLVFINAPYDRYVTEDTRFWHASGLEIQVGASGLNVDTQSLASLVAGGLAFQEPPDTELGAPAPEQFRFNLAENQAEAMKNEAGAITAVAYFPQSLRGLSVGAPIDFRGVEVGEVVDIDMRYDREKRNFIQPVTVKIYPDRFFTRDTKDGRKLLDGMVQRGFRAQLRQANLLTGQLYVALDFFPKAPAVKVDPNSATLVLPTMGGGLDELQAAVEDIVGKIRKIPFDEIGNNLNGTLSRLNRETLVELNRTLAQARSTLSQAETTIGRVDRELTPEAKAVLSEARQTLNGASAALSPDAPLQGDVRDTLRELQRTARSLRNVADYLERHPEALLRGKTGDAQ